MKLNLFGHYSSRPYADRDRFAVVIAYLYRDFVLEEPCILYLKRRTEKVDSDVTLVITVLVACYASQTLDHF